MLSASLAKARVHLAAAGATEIWVPAFPTELIRGLKAHGTAARVRFHPGRGRPLAGGELGTGRSVPASRRRRRRLQFALQKGEDFLPHLAAQVPALPGAAGAYQSAQFRLAVVEYICDLQFG